MRPHLLRLRGFRGIHDGLRRDELTLDLDQLTGEAALVALVGSNGRGKTTVLDNLHPYLALPSRVAAVGGAGFSYYDHVYLPESEKELIWSQGGVRYRTHIVIRCSGRRRTEAYLFVDEGGRWVPAVLPDGTTSDGKVDTYARCVSGLCGRPETFVASAFSAQGRTPLASYRTAEIKGLLADLLDQDELQRWGAQAEETARLLRSGLALLRRQQAADDQEEERLEGRRLPLVDAPVQLQTYAAARAEASRALHEAQHAHAACRQEHRRFEQCRDERDRLAAQRASLIEQGRAAIASLDGQDRREVERGQALRRRAAVRREHARERCIDLECRIDALRRTLREAPSVRRAQRRRGVAGRIEEERKNRLVTVRQAFDEWEQARQALAGNDARQAEVEQAAGQAMLAADDLRQRVGLTGQVPCAGSDLQARCPLLGDAHHARTLIPSAQARIDHLAQTRRGLRAERRALQALLRRRQGAREGLDRAERAAERACLRSQRLAVQAARLPDVEQAQAALPDAMRAMSAAQRECSATPREEEEEAQRIEVARQAIADQRRRQAADFRAALDVLDETIRALPARWPDDGLARSAAHLAAAEAAAETARQAHEAVVRDVATLQELDAQCCEARRRRRDLRRRLARLEQALRTWTLFARCLGKDGLIALAIDDAGPVLADLANTLLLACYGARFTLSIHTLVATAKGEEREGFEIVVHDADTGQSKALSMTSGGERVWIEACLTRAVALYLARKGGCRYETLFSDEADGALDPERKRMWMAMKREVLRLGGYAREFFISQTPELATMADAVVDLDAMVAQTLPRVG